MNFLVLYAPNILLLQPQGIKGVRMTKENGKNAGDIVTGGVTYAKEMVFSIETADQGCYPEPVQQPEELKDPETEYFTEEQIAEYFGVKIRVVRKWVADKRLGCVQLTKRKKVFTQALIDEFVRKESGLPAHQGVPGKGAAGLAQTPRTPISVEESRALLKGLTKKT
jgi:hypothetical protein